MGLSAASKLFTKTDGNANELRQGEAESEAKAITQGTEKRAV